MKLPVDLSSDMPSYEDQTAKLGSLAFMCTMMVNLMPSLASMDNTTLLANAIDEMELAEKTLKGISKSMNSFISKAEKDQNDNLQKLLEKSMGFEGMELFDTDDVKCQLELTSSNFNMHRCCYPKYPQRLRSEPAKKCWRRSFVRPSNGRKPQ
ncbi:hypothetical protein Tco_0731108 [Tanacetum coccineum]